MKDVAYKMKSHGHHLGCWLLLMKSPKTKRMSIAVKQDNGSGSTTLHFWCGKQQAKNIAAWIEEYIKTLPRKKRKSRKVR